MQIKQTSSKTDRVRERHKSRTMQVNVAGLLLSPFHRPEITLWSSDRQRLGHDSFRIRAWTPRVLGHTVICSALSHFAVLCIFSQAGLPNVFGMRQLLSGKFRGHRTTYNLKSNSS